MSGGSKGHRRGRRHHGGDHEEHTNHEAWVIPYADMLTLLMAMFLVMWSGAQLDLARFATIRDSLRQSFGGTQLVVDGGDGLSDGTQGLLDGLVLPTPTTLPVPDSPEDLDEPSEIEPVRELIERTNERTHQQQQEAGELSDLGSELVRQLVDEGLLDPGEFTVDLRVRGLALTLLSEVLFRSGSAELTPQGRAVVDDLAPRLRDTGRDLVVEGHTDPLPISTWRYPSNWELSAARAATVARELISRGVPADRISIAGYADTRPVADNSTPEGRRRNRRVEVVVIARLPLTDTATGAGG